MNKQGKIEKIFEKILWESKKIVILAVISAIIGAIILVLIGTYEMLSVIPDLPNSFDEKHYEEFEKEAVMRVVGAIDIYLIATVLLIFGVGMYEIFISKIDIAEKDTDTKARNILIIHSLDELKDKLLKVIIIVLIVTCFNYAISINLEDTSKIINIIYFGIVIVLMAVAMFLISKSSHKKQQEK